MLQPTKALGDFELKDPVTSTIPDFNGPYIDYKPSFTHFKIKQNSEYLILATDGMWDELKAEEVSEIANYNQEGLAKELFQACMKHIEKRNKMSE